MTPESVLSNVASMLQSLMVPAAIVAALVAVLVYGFAKLTDSPNSVRWAKGAALGAIVLYSGNAAIGILQNLASRTIG